MECPTQVFFPRPKFGLLTSVLLVLGSAAQAATISKANNIDDLHLSSSWIGGLAPSYGDIAQWDATVTGPNTATFPGALTWQGIKVTNPGGLVTVNGGTLWLGSATTDIDLATAAQDLVLNCGVVVAGDNVWDIAYRRTLDVTGAIAGISGGIFKQGFGTAVLNGDNAAFPQDITLYAGVLIVGHSNALGNTTGETTVNGTGRSALHFKGGVNVNELISSLNTAALAGLTAYGCVRSVSGDNVLSQFMDAGNSSPRIGADAGSTLTLTGILLNPGRTATFVGAGDIIVHDYIWSYPGAANIDRRLGPGTLRLAAEDDWSGFTRLYDGTLLLDYSIGITSLLPDTGNLGLNAGTLVLIGGSYAEIVGATTVGANAPGGATRIRQMDGTSTLRMNVITRSVGGTVDFGAAGIADAADNITVNDIVPWATIAAADWATKLPILDAPITNYVGYQTAADPALWAATDNVSLSGDPTVSLATRVINSLRLTGPATVQIDPDATLTLSAGGLLVTGGDPTTIAPAGGRANLNGAPGGDLIVHQHSSADLTVSVSITNNTSATALTKSGQGRLILTGTNTYTGATFINEGTLSISANQNLGAPASGATIYFNGGTLQATATFALDEAGANKRNLQLGETVRSTIEVTPGNAFTVSGAMMGRGWLTKTGGGTLVLTGTNTYAGETIIRAGTMLVNGAIGFGNPVWSNTVATVEAGGILGGGGTVGSNTSIRDGGTLAPGVSIGTIKINGDLTLSGATVLAFELKGNSTFIGGGINDLATVNGALTLDGILNVTEAAPGSFMSASDGNKWRLFNYTNTVDFKDNGLALGSMPTLSSGLKFAIDTATAGQVNLMVVSAVAPRPRIISVSGAGTTNVTVLWTNAVMGTNYILQYNTNLNEGNWTDLGPVTATGTTASQTDHPLGGETPRYYRVRVE